MICTVSASEMHSGSCAENWSAFFDWSSSVISQSGYVSLIPVYASRLRTLYIARRAIHRIRTRDPMFVRVIYLVSIQELNHNGLEARAEFTIEFGSCISVSSREINPSLCKDVNTRTWERSYLWSE